MGAARRRVVITGLGLVSPWGNAVEPAFAAAMAGQSAIRCNPVGAEPHAVTIASAVGGIARDHFMFRCSCRAGSRGSS